MRITIKIVIIKKNYNYDKNEIIKKMYVNIILIIYFKIIPNNKNKNYI